MIEQGPFTSDFLEHGIHRDEECAKLFAESKKFLEEAKKLREKFKDIDHTRDLGESSVERRIVIPVLKALGWKFSTQQRTSPIGAETADFALFADSESFEEAEGTEDIVVQLHNLATILEAKRLRTKLGHEGKGPRSSKKKDDKDKKGPESQIRGYMTEVASYNPNVNWGVLTNGRFWRLYRRGAHTYAEKYFEIDLWAALGLLKDSEQQELVFEPDSSLNKQEYVLTLFALLFSPRAFAEIEVSPSLLDFALDESRRWRLKITQDLTVKIFKITFPKLIESMKSFVSTENLEKKTADELGGELQSAALTFLFRALFILYAEDRNLLPIRNRFYRKRSLRKIRAEISRQLNRDKHNTFDKSDSFKFWNHFMRLCEIINGQKDGNLRLPPYNGGLFKKDHAPLLQKIKLSDYHFVEIFDEITRAEISSKQKQKKSLDRAWINFRDLSARELGTIYEQLSQYKVELHYSAPQHKAGGEWQVKLKGNLRKVGGIYYTPDDLVRLILDKTLTPLAKECEKQEDPATALLNLKILDPAMGSGHFLVGATDWLTNRIEVAIDKAIEEDRPCRVFEEIKELRKEIMENAEDGKWDVDESKHLDTSSLIRRMVLKRCIHGVDKNLYAVEIAKLALWLHSFTVGAPLSYLDHHIQWGNSLYGEKVASVIDFMSESVGPLYVKALTDDLKVATKQMADIESTPDIDFESVKHSEEVHRDLQNKIQIYEDTFSFFQALRWSCPNIWQGGKNGVAKQIRTWMTGQGEKLPVAILSREEPDEKKLGSKELKDTFKHTYDLMNKEHFFHWELAFPHIWQEVTNEKPQGGFDAVLSNPPWERVTKGTTDVTGDSLYYPRTGKGVRNYYALFAERAQNLIKPNGYVGMLTPNGLATDKTCAEFFRQVSINGRVVGIFDFENKKTFFPAVHAQLRFIASIIGGESHRFEETEYAAFLSSVAEIKGGTDERSGVKYDGRGFHLTAEHFALVNPNLGSVPFFPSTDDRDLVLDVYDRLSVLDEENGNPVWNLDCATISIPSDISGRKENLIKKGFEQDKNTNLIRALKQGEHKVYTPLYQGRMVHHFEHRISVGWEDKNPKRKYKTVHPDKQTDLPNPHFFADPYEWAEQKTVQKKLKKIKGEYFLAFRDITSATNARTMIATIMPRYGFLDNSLHIVIPVEGKEKEYKECLPLLCANFNSLALDYIARCKVQATHVKWYMVQQFPIIPFETFQKIKIGQTTAETLVRDDVLRLIYTAHDLDAFGRDHGCGKPFQWDEEERTHLQARLNALFFILYEFKDENVKFILKSFEKFGHSSVEARKEFRSMSKLILGYIEEFRKNNPNAWLSNTLPFPKRRR